MFTKWKVETDIEINEYRINVCHNCPTEPMCQHSNILDCMRRDAATDEATAHLIAAAPDLYEACKEALITLNVLQKGDSAVIREIKRAIAKAEGK